ncbi:MAG: hypothetical protein AB7G11_01470 [Phycisphaerales bacterium]
MGRLARWDVPKQTAAGVLHIDGDEGPPPPGKPPPRGDKPLARVAKYVPAETVAFFLGAKNLIEQAKSEDINQGLWLNICFSIALAGTPIYLWWQRETDRPWIVNTVVATIAFPLWVFALDCKYGWFSGIPQVISGLLILIYTFAAGLIKPVK